MSELFTQLGINIPALLAQAFNFAVVLVVLTFVVYRPLMAMVEKRSRDIQKGLDDADEAAGKLREAESMKSEVLSEAEREALALVRAAEGDAKAEGEKVLKEMQGKAEDLVRDAYLFAERQRVESMASVEKEAASFVRAVLEKTVGLDPQAVDNLLVDEALAALKKERV